MKLLENSCEVCFRNTDPGIPHLHTKPVLSPPATNQNTAGLRVAERVADEIAGNALEQARIRIDDCAGRNKPQFQADCLGLRLVLLPEPVQYRRDREA